jgi:hypothetical protein
VHAGARQRFELLRLGHQQRWRLVRSDNLRWMRIEGHGDRRRPPLLRTPAHALDDLQVPAMHAVEIAQRQHGLVPSRPLIVGVMNDIHG